MDGPSTHSKIYVPSCWESLPGLESWRGKAEFRRRVPVARGRDLRLLFGGASHTAQVFVDGLLCGSHHDAYTPFEVIIPNVGRDDADLRVVVDNTFGSGSALHFSNDYYTYGGLTRPVVAETLPAVFIKRLHAIPVMEGGKWLLDLRVSVSAGSTGETHSLVVALDGREIHRETISRRMDGEALIAARVPAGDVGPWTPGSPQLHEISAVLLDASGTPVDDQIDRVGFRTVNVEGDRILLNGSPLRLRGFNRHEDHAIFGCAVPPAAMAHDLALMRSTGANFVRTSHYPNDRRFLDLCDETGMLVWEESHARQISFEHPKALEQSLASTREMLDWHRNHPSIILWGCLNECDTISDSGVEFHRQVLELIRATDPSRPSTYAGHHHLKDRAMHLADVVSHNIYTGWYRGTAEDVAGELDKLLGYVDSPESGGRGKPFLVSEFGAGAMAGFRSPPMLKLTEDYQAELLEKSIQVYDQHPRLSGLCIWHFADCRVSEEGNWWMHRPRNINDKGVFTRDRTPKLAAQVVHRAFQKP